MSNIDFSDDQSLQRAGANLRGVEAAADEVARAYAAAAAQAEQFNSTFGRVAQQWESDLPTSPRLQADIEALKVKASQATTPDQWRSVAAEAATLPGRYAQEHETDEDRMNAPRRSRAAERRADVTSAEQDN